MMSEIDSPARVCINCGEKTAVEIRRDELFGQGKDALIIENIPMMKCLNCALVYLEPQVSRMIDEICAHPDQYASVESRAVAKIA